MIENNPKETVIGGRVNCVVRIGDTVRRKTGPYTASVHALLNHLKTAGFAGAPNAHGLDESGREILDFIPGTAGAFPLPDFLLTDKAILDYGSLIRAYHDASSSFVHFKGTWFLPAKEPVEVICHGDLSPDNCVFYDGQPRALIDFDVAHPGPRVWDLGYAACCFIPLQPPQPEEDPGMAFKKQCRRLRLLCDGYGLHGSDRAAVVDNAYDRLIHLVEQIEEKAAEGIQAFSDSLAAGHTRMFLGFADYIDTHRNRFKAAVEQH